MKSAVWVPNHIFDSRDRGSLCAAHDLDMIVSTVNVKLDWNIYLYLLKPNGVLHFVSSTVKPLDIRAVLLIGGQKTVSVSGSSTGSPAQLRIMIDFAARKQVEPVVEELAMSDVNRSMEHLESGKARYRIVLKNDFKRSETFAKIPCNHLKLLIAVIPAKAGIHV